MTLCLEHYLIPFKPQKSNQYGSFKQISGLRVGSYPTKLVVKIAGCQALKVEVRASRALPELRA